MGRVAACWLFPGWRRLQQRGLTTKLKEPSLRFASFYSPMGFVRDHFFPEKDSQDFLSMPTLSPLKKVGDKVTLITGLSRVNVRGVDVHNQCSSCYLSSADPHGPLKSVYPMDRTLDHLIADQGKPSHADSILGTELQYVQRPQRIDLLRQHLLVWARACGDVDQRSAPGLSDSFQDRQIGQRHYGPDFAGCL